jgi:hypothetical protein
MLWLAWVNVITIMMMSRQGIGMLGVQERYLVAHYSAVTLMYACLLPEKDLRGCLHHSDVNCTSFCKAPLLLVS